MNTTTLFLIFSLVGNIILLILFFSEKVKKENKTLLNISDEAKYTAMFFTRALHDLPEGINSIQFKKILYYLPILRFDEIGLLINNKINQIPFEKGTNEFDTEVDKIIYDIIFNFEKALEEYWVYRYGNERKFNDPLYLIDSVVVKENSGDEPVSKYECIPINIWDDFWDDGCVPEGEKQATYIFVEDPDIPKEKTQIYLQLLLDYINKNLNVEGVTLWMEFYESRNEYPEFVGNRRAEELFFERWEIKVQGLSHERLDEWMQILETVDIKVDDIPFDIYSES